MGRASEPSAPWSAAGPAADEAGGVVLIVEDHEMIADALALGLAWHGSRAVVAELGGRESVADQAKRLRPSLVLLDLDLGGSDGVDLISELRATGARVLMATGSRDQPRLAVGVALGAVGWVSKTEPFEVLLETVEMALRDRPLLSAAKHEELIRLGRERLEAERDFKVRMALLTLREREVLASLCDGKCAQEIARQLVVSLGTVRNHIAAILNKLGVSTQLAAVATARGQPSWRHWRRAQEPSPLSQRRSGTTPRPVVKSVS